MFLSSGSKSYEEALTFNSQFGVFCLFSVSLSSSMFNSPLRGLLRASAAGEGGFGCVFGELCVRRASDPEVTLSCFLCIFLTGDFQPTPSLLGDSGSSGQEREQFAGRADVLHCELMNYIKARFCNSTHFPLLGTSAFRSKDFSWTCQSSLLFALKAFSTSSQSLILPAHPQH